MSHSGDFVYSVSMTANERTYEYDIYRFDGSRVLRQTVRYADLIRFNRHLSNAEHAFLWLDANAALVFDESKAEEP